MRRAALAFLLVLTGCDGGPAAPPTPAPTGAGPYTVSAIDYHFHDAHPSAPIRLDRAVRFTNKGSNIHNVTFQTVRYGRDLPVGSELVIDPASSLFPGPGRYRFFCSYHRDRRMGGVLVVV